MQNVSCKTVKIGHRRFFFLTKVSSHNHSAVPLCRKAKRTRERERERTIFQSEPLTLIQPLHLQLPDRKLSVTPHTGMVGRASDGFTVLQYHKKV